MGEVLRVDQASPAPAVLERARGVLAAGGVVVMPTDSVYGIGCAATPGNPGHARVFEIKRRDRSLTLPLLVADPSELAALARDLPAWGTRLASALWPGALTVVVRASERVPADYLRPDGTVALRVPDSGLVRALARRGGGPLAVTSANVHGEPAAAAAASSSWAIIRRGVELLAAAPTGWFSPGLVTRPTPSPPSISTPGVSRRDTRAKTRAPSVMSGSSPPSFSTAQEAQPVPARCSSSSASTAIPAGVMTRTTASHRPDRRNSAAPRAAAAAQVPVVYPQRRRFCPTLI